MLPSGIRASAQNSYSFHTLWDHAHVVSRTLSTLPSLAFVFFSFAFPPAEVRSQKGGSKPLLWFDKSLSQWVEQRMCCFGKKRRDTCGSNVTSSLSEEMSYSYSFNAFHRLKPRMEVTNFRLTRDPLRPKMPLVLTHCTRLAIGPHHTYTLAAPRHMPYRCVWDLECLHLMWGDVAHSLSQSWSS